MNSRLLAPNIDYAKGEQWLNEEFHRNSLCVGFKKLGLEQDDVVFVSDLDEIVNPLVIQRIRSGDILLADGANHLKMDMYYYNLCCRSRGGWHKSFATKMGKNMDALSDLNKMRLAHPANLIQNGGLHLSYFGDLNFIKNKIQDFSHQELNNDHYKNGEYLQRCIKENRAFFSPEHFEYI